MKLVSFKNQHNQERAGLFVDKQTYDLAEAGRVLGADLPSTMNELLSAGNKAIEAARNVERAIQEGRDLPPVTDITPLAPVPHPPSCRDGYAFRQHVATARRNRGVDMIPEFDQYPVFYFTNHNAIFGEGDIIVESDHLQRLDFELECAIVIGRHGRNIDARQADQYIAGYTIMNDWSARLLQMEEMKLNLGPAKGKDFATSIGPWLVTVDELEPYRVPGESGNRFDLKMTARHNGTLISEGNLKDMDWTFAEIIERASYGVDLYPGDVIGSGTVGTGCYLELNGTRRLEADKRGEPFTPTWLDAGDTMELEITALGRLTNRIVKAPTDRSILAKKKNVELSGR
jgi:fumarylacetoacetate (FAA) hydrolase